MTGDDAQLADLSDGAAAPPSEPSGVDPGRLERREATDAEARALASSLRLRILRLTLDEALTNKEIARALDRNPASVLHHVRTLVDTGFLTAEPERRGVRGAREIPYRATGKAWYLDAPGVLAGSIVEAFVSEIAGVTPEQRDFVRLRINGGDVQEFQKRLYEVVADFRQRPRDPQSPPHSVFIAMHPDTSVVRRDDAP
ncbi:helix-turn-helix domain-containing protein [Ornithinimicrobium sp. F0845]|uniref:ArsR/SmtB family transcription factor n=1 Tax=Ornithinimicrobium sp. F0845 TaxID=2926412 RepID=UPI001FF2D98A|nr:helix-turn-helix domain-containing protein [Ornithinimicrobium sp. F0845]MCK0111615.1 helix-turn-helix domain-containing protein [Ornithinimicrobium sp. F0845]